MNTCDRKRARSGRRFRRRAAVMVMAGLGLTSALLLCGLVIDVGNVCVSKAELQRSSDAAALAAAAVMLDRNDLNGQPNPSLVSHIARSAAIQYVQLNPCRGVAMTLPRNDNNAESGDLVLGHYNSTTQEFDPSDNRYNSGYVFIRRDRTQNGPIPLYFGGLIGLPAINAHGEAAAFIESDISGFSVGPGSNVNCKLLPFSLQIDLWNNRTALGEDTHTHDTVNHTALSGPDGIFEISLFPHRLAPGNFGTVDIGHPGNSASDLRRQILHGPNAWDLSFFPNSTVQLNQNGILMLNGDTGVTASMKAEIGQILGQPRIIPLHARVTGQGNNAWFEVVAFVGITILDYKLTGALRDRYIKIQPCYTGDSTAIGGGNDGITSKFVFVPPRLRRAR
jgi:Flp pilus assembly protein TadG